ncbi:tetratricopeptide repeat protein [Aquisphaera insulae]|uniref:tetratricopeptide repeat protein n=1 Tax=Aquisphaera insulae TaxID=2712864 RepID=UPI0013EB3D18|nr:tetratricopeptide repeat protein [Aquisphaera insulae]
MRKLNLPFLLSLLAIAAILGVTTYFVHSWQVRRQVANLLNRARLAEEARDLPKAADCLVQYLSLNREDAETWKWYARILDEKDREVGAKEQVFLVHERALQFNPDDEALERRCADLAMELVRYSDAERHLKKLLSRAGTAEKPRDKAELGELLGQCAVGGTRFEEAESLFRQSIKDDPERASAYYSLARLKAGNLRQPETGAEIIGEMRARNPESARALVLAWRFRSEFQPPADPKDIEQALARAPQDPEVLLAAAIASEEKGDFKAARSYWSRGNAVEPGKPAFAIGLARAEIRDQRPDQAEAILRQAYKVTPSSTLAIFLTEALILQGKIEGDGNAAEWIAMLRSRGLGDTYARYLDCQVLVRQQQWEKAIVEIQRARVLLKEDPAVMEQLHLMLAQCYRQVGRDDEQLQALQQASEAGGASDAARQNLAQALVRSGKVDQALAVLRPLADRRPDLQAEVVRLLIQQTLRQPRDRRDWTAAEAAMQQAEKARPAAIEANTLLRADLLLAEGKPDEASSRLTSALERDPKNTRYRLALARLDEQRGKPDAAMSRIDAAEKELGPGLEILLARLDALAQRGPDARPAVAQMAEAGKKLPDSDQPAFLERLAGTELRVGQPELARQHLRELAAIQPASVRTRLALFDLAQEANDVSEATSLLEQVRKLEGEEGTTWRYCRAILLLGQARVGQGSSGNPDPRITADVENLVAEIAKRRPNWWGAPVIEAQVAELRNQPDKAALHYQRAVGLGNVQSNLIQRLTALLYQTQQFDQIDALGRTLADRGVMPGELAVIGALNALRRGELDQGVALARQIFSENSRSPFELLFLGRILLFAQRTSEAEKPLSRALELAPQNPENWTTFVELLLKAGRKSEVAPLLEKAKLALPAKDRPLTLAVCQAMADDDQNAADSFKAALALRPDDATTLRRAGEFYVKIMDMEKAREVMARILDPATKSPEANITWARRVQGLVGMSSGGIPQIDQALGLIDQNLRADPFSFKDQTARAILLSMRPGRREEAIRALEALDRNHLLGLNEQFTLAMLHGAERDWAKCQARLLKILERSREPRYLVYLVSILLEQGDLAAAEKWLRELKPLLPDNLAAIELEARVLKARDRASDAQSLIRTFSGSHPDQALAVADLLERLGILDESESTLRRFVAEKPDEPTRILPLIGFLARRNRLEEALPLCDQAWKTCPPEAAGDACMTVASSRQASDALRRKIETGIQEALKRKPGEPRLQVNLAQLFSLGGRFDEAEATYRDVLAREPKNIAALNNLAWLLALHSKKPQDALGLINTAIEAAGDVVPLLDTRAAVYLQMEQPEPALKDLKAALAVNPRYPSLSFHLAQAHRQSRNAQEARKAFETARQLSLTRETVDPLEKETFRLLESDVQGP